MTTEEMLDEDHDHSHLPVVRLTRRGALSALGGLGAAVVLAACGSSSGSGSAATTATSSATTGGSSATTAGSAATTAAATATTAASSSATTAAAASSALEWLTPPGETGGPFPADGSNQNGKGATANMLTKSGSFRTDMTADLDGTNKQPGIPMTLKVKVGKKADKSAYAGAAVYVWHCNADGHYSQYSGNMNGGDFADRTFLRAIGVADANGDITFTSILPGRYQGRATHIHFAVFSDKALGTRLITSQFAFDDTEADTLYKSSSTYSASLSNPTYNKADNVFSDGFTNQLLDLAGSSAVEAAIHILV